MTKRLAEDHVTMFGNTFLELLLEVAAAMLVLAKLRDLPNEILQTRSREPVDCTYLVRTTSTSPNREQRCCQGRTLTVDVTALVLGPVQAVHLPICASVRTSVHVVEPVLSPVVMVQRR